MNCFRNIFMSFLGPKEASGAGCPPNYYSQRPQSVPNYPAHPPTNFYWTKRKIKKREFQFFCHFHPYISWYIWLCVGLLYVNVNKLKNLLKLNACGHFLSMRFIQTFLCSIESTLSISYQFMMILHIPLVPPPPPASNHWSTLWTKIKIFVWFWNILP